MRTARYAAAVGEDATGLLPWMVDILQPVVRLRDIGGDYGPMRRAGVSDALGIWIKRASSLLRNLRRALRS